MEVVERLVLEVLQEHLEVVVVLERMVHPVRLVVLGHLEQVERMEHRVVLALLEAAGHPAHQVKMV
jgi:hypothetical protein